MDATLWPQYCKDTLKVVPNTWLAHLPTTVLYSRGKEVDRLPRLEDIDEIGLKRNYYTKVRARQMMYILGIYAFRALVRARFSIG